MSVKTTNLIPNRNSIFNELTNDWVGLNAVTARSGTKIYNPTLNRNVDVDLAYYALSVTPINHSQACGAKLDLGNISKTNNGKWFQAHALIYSDVTISIDCVLSIDDELSIDNDPPVERLITIIGGKWSVVRTYLTQVPDDDEQHTVNIIFNSSSGTNKPIYIAVPGVIWVDQLLDDQFSLNVMRSLPDMYFEQLRDDNFINVNSHAPFATFRFLNLGLADANEVLLLFLNYTRFTKEQKVDFSNPLIPGTHRSALVDPLAADEQTIPWLAQFAGRTLVDSKDIFASHLNFPQDTETIEANLTFTALSVSDITLTREAGTVYTNTASIDSSFFSGTGVVRVKSEVESDITFDGIFILKDISDTTKLSWTQDQYDATSSSTVTITEVSAESVAQYAANRHTFNQYQVNSRHFGIGAGTISSISNAVKELLSGNKEVAISYDDQWIINIQTRLDETPTYLLSTTDFNVLESIITPIIPVGHVATFSTFPSAGGERMALDQDPEGRLNLYALGNP